MATAHVWDGTGLTEVVAFGMGRSETFDKLQVGDKSNSWRQKSVGVKEPSIANRPPQYSINRRGNEFQGK